MKKYTRKDSNGEVGMDKTNFFSLKKEQTVVCYNEEEERSHLLEFFCCVCNRHFKGVKAGETHWNQSKHKKALTGHFSRLKYVWNTPPLTPEEESEITSLIVKTEQERIMSEENYEMRLRICREVDEVIKATGIFDVRSVLYGSSSTKLGFEEADVNIDISYDLEKISTSHPDLSENTKLLFHLYTTISESDKFCDVKDLFHVNFPSFTFTHVESGLQCVVCPHYKPGIKTAWLIKDYASLDSRVKPLCAAFKHWATVCGLDDVDGGSLSLYCYTLMVIHFLQQIRPPVLPVIDVHGYQYLPKDVKPSANADRIAMEQIGNWKSTNAMSLGSLWVQLFRYYLVEFFFSTLVVNITQHAPMTKQVRALNGRRLSMEDPYFLKDNVANSLVSSGVMEYFMVCLDKSYRHYARCLEPEKGDPTSPERSPSKKGEKKKKKKDRQETEYNDAPGDRNKGEEKTDNEELDKDKEQNEDNWSRTRNESITSDLVFPSAEDEFSDTEHEDDDDNDDDAVEFVADENGDKDEHEENDVDVVHTSGATEVKSEPTEVTEQVTRDIGNLAITPQSEDPLIFKSDNIEQIVKCVLDDVVLKVDDPSLAEKESELIPFTFERKSLAPSKRVPLYCKICAEDGHRSSECNSMGLGSVTPLKQLPGYFLQLLSSVCMKIFNDNKLTEQEKQSRTKVLSEVERHLQKFFDPNVRLALFGSSVNNFGFQGSNRGRSDMDICMRLKPEALPEGFDPALEIVKISKALDKSPNYQKVMYIKSAKVPIVKFAMRESNLEGDISLYNCLALKNSTMLKDTSEIDNRARVLGYCIKVFAKICEIGDASRGSLSSYAYILLMFFYLQRCEPPVIPVLQELYDHKKPKPTSIIEGWDTWYYDQLGQLQTVWPGYNKNKQTVGELWLGFFKFYVEKFDFGRNVVAMRQTKTLTKFEKNWTRATMAIEDPFNLNHNLAAGISRNMFKYWLGCFRAARAHFGTLNASVKQDANADFLMEYFFNREKLTGNADVPKDRLCHRCGRIGHTASNCAEKIAADRDRRRHDSQGGDSSDSDRKFSGRNNGEKNITCYGCNKTGHRVANCPEKLQQQQQRMDNGRKRHNSNSKSNNFDNGNNNFSSNNSTSNNANANHHGNNNRNDGSNRLSWQSSQGNEDSSMVQASTDPHPMERFDTVLGKSEMTTRQGKKGKQKTYQSSGRDMDVSSVNALFAQPKTESTYSQFNPPQRVSSDNVSFIQGDVMQQSGFHGSPSPQKGSPFPHNNNNNNYPPSPSNPSNMNWMGSPGKGVQADASWMSRQPQDFNRAIGSPVSKQQQQNYHQQQQQHQQHQHQHQQPQPLMSAIVPEPNNRPMYDNFGGPLHNSSMQQQQQQQQQHRFRENDQINSPKGVSSSTPPVRTSKGRGRGRRNDSQQQHNQHQQPQHQQQQSAYQMHQQQQQQQYERSMSGGHRKSSQESYPGNVPMAHAPSTPEGKGRGSGVGVHWQQQQQHQQHQQPFNSGTPFDKFVKSFNAANSPPKSSPLKDSSEVGEGSSSMMYDEDYTSNIPPRGTPANSSGRRGKRDKK